MQEDLLLKAGISKAEQVSSHQNNMLLFKLPCYVSQHTWALISKWDRDKGPIAKIRIVSFNPALTLLFLLSHIGCVFSPGNILEAKLSKFGCGLMPQLLLWFWAIIELWTLSWFSASQVYTNTPGNRGVFTIASASTFRRTLMVLPIWYNVVTSSGHLLDIFLILNV